MLKLALAAALLTVPSVANAEFRASKGSAPRTQKQQVEATIVAMKSALTIDSMLDKINGPYMTGLRRCYSKGLASDPTLKGKITVTFSIGGYGKVWGEAEGISKQVDGCIADQIKRWSFGKPSDTREQNYTISLVLAQ